MDIDLLRIIIRKKHKRLSQLSEHIENNVPSVFSVSMNQYIKRTIHHIDKNMDMKKKKELILKNKQNNVEEDLKLANNFNVGYYIITPLFIGVFLGLFLDNIFKTKPLFILTCLVFGTIASFYNIWKTIKE